MSVPKYKIFDGKRYTLFATSRYGSMSLKDARYYADDLRTTFNMHSRVVKINDGYYVYARDGTGYTKARKMGFGPSKINRTRTKR